MQLARQPRQINRSILRPRRCNFCRKMISNQQYNNHVRDCANQRNRAQSMRPVQQSRPNQTRNNFVSQNKNNNSRQTVQNQNNLQRNRVNQQPIRNTHNTNQFRIKNVPPPPVPVSRPDTRNNVQMANQNPQQLQIRPNQVQIQERQITNSNINEINSEQRIQIIPQQRHQIHIEIQQPNQYIEPSIIPNQNNQPFRFQIFQFVQQNNEQPLQQLIRNTQRIIQFIRNMQVYDQTLQLMVGQLQQLNNIGQQIVMMNQLGRSLSYNMDSLFSSRIRQLQRVIINQIGMALLRGIQNFQNQRRVRVDGFTQSDIKNKFRQIYAQSIVQCPICLQQVQKGQKIIKLQCKHDFHPSCIVQWLKSSKKCPMCRHIQC